MTDQNKKWLAGDPAWRYHDATSHRTSTAFARRQQQRRRDVQEAAKVAVIPNVRSIKRSKTV